MPRRPDLLCSSCEKPMWRGKASAPKGEAMCRPCRAERNEEWRRDGRPCATCGRVTGRTTKRECLRCEVGRNGGQCDVYKCEQKTIAKGLCSSHYVYQWRTAEGRSLNGKGTWIEPKRRREIYERDNWECGICGDAIDRDAGVNDALAPSLDHILPRSLGGGHSSDNLRAAHRFCNASRGARV